MEYSAKVRKKNEGERGWWDYYYYLTLYLLGGRTVTIGSIDSIETIDIIDTIETISPMAIIPFSLFLEIAPGMHLRGAV